MMDQEKEQSPSETAVKHSSSKGSLSSAEVREIRQDFPILSSGDVIYLDNAATSQKPRQVLDTLTSFYEHSNANPYRGFYDLAIEATDIHEEARQTLADFVHAKSKEEIIFTRNATESLNLVAYSLGSILLKPGDEILVSIMEHHSNLLPWQQAAKRTGATLKYLDCTKEGTLTPQMLKEMLTPATKLAAITHVSNVLGWENDLKEMARICHENGTLILADGAQSVPHLAVDVVDLDVDFLAFSGHKMLGPMGIGCLYGKKKWLEKMPPFLTGGEMIDSVTREGAVYAEVPHKFEAGTVNAGGAAAMAEAARYLQQIGLDRISQREENLTVLVMEQMEKIPGVHILGSKDPTQHHGIVTFTVDGVHPHDVSAIFNEDHIAVRAGHHCAQPLLNHLGVSSATRVSLAFYNTEEEAEAFIKSLKEVRGKMGYV